jgi:hypothetical protein
MMFAGALAAVSDGGLNAQFAPVGSPEHAKLTDCLLPLCGVTVNVIVPLVPAVSVSAEVLNVDSE